MLKFSSSRFALIFVVASLAFHSIRAANLSPGEGNTNEEVSKPKCLLTSYVNIEDRRYFFQVDLKLNQSDASKHCQKLNMELVSLEDSVENASISNMIKEYGPNCFSKPYWTSGYRIRNNFYWGSGSPFVYAHWQYSEPNNAHSNENCVYIGPYFLQWNDGNCNDEYNFICESAINPNIY